MAIFGGAIIRGACAKGRKRTGFIALAAVFFALAVFTKEQVLPAILLVPLAFRCWGEERGGALRRSATRATIPFAGIALAFVALYLTFGPERTRLGGDPPAYVVLAVARTVCYYTLVLFIPTARWIHTLSLGPFVALGDWILPIAVALLGGVAILFFRLLRVAPEAAWFLAWISLTLFAVSNVVPIWSMLVCPYRAGVAGVGAAALAAWLLEVVAIRGASAPGGRTAAPSVAAYGLAAVFLLWWGTLSIWAIRQWADDVTIARTIARFDPDSLFARENLATSLLRLHRSAEARREMETLLARLFPAGAWRDPAAVNRALASDPRIQLRLREMQSNGRSPEEWLAGIYSRLGMSYLEAGRMDDADRALRAGYAICRTDAETDLGMGLLAFTRGRTAQAEGYIRVALAKEPDSAAGHSLLARVLSRAGEHRAARSEAVTWEKLQSWSRDAYVFEAQEDRTLGDYAAARAALQAEARNAICDANEVRVQIAAITAEEARRAGLGRGPKEPASR
jgi:Flp pilus assembly protein TadD